MGRNCIICNLHDTDCTKHSFHIIPLGNLDVRKEWLNFLRTCIPKDLASDPTMTKSKTYSICSQHFVADDFATGRTGKRFLKRSAVPSVIHPAPQQEDNLTSSDALTVSQLETLPETQFILNWTFDESKDVVTSNIDLAVPPLKESLHSDTDRVSTRSSTITITDLSGTLTASPSSVSSCSPDELSSDTAEIIEITKRRRKAFPRNVPTSHFSIPQKKRKVASLVETEVETNMNPNEVIILNKDEYANGVPSVLDFNEICRLCLLAITETESTKSIHDEHFNMSIKSLLEIYTLLKIPAQEEDDRLPPNICLDCANFLIEMHTFRSRCQVSNDILQKISKQVKDEHEEEDTARPITPQLMPFETISIQLRDIKLGGLQCNDCNIILDDETFFTHSCKTIKPAVKAIGKLKLCSICNKVVNSQWMSKHMRTHSKVNPHNTQHNQGAKINCMPKVGRTEHKCNYCGYRGTKHNLERHMLQHTGIKPFMCSVCGKGFTQMTVLKIHEKRHLKRPDERKRESYTHRQGRICEYCRYGFINQALLEEHIAVAHNNGKFPTVEENDKTFYKCPHSGCNETFEFEFDLTKHTRITHINRLPYTCSVCDRTFKVRCWLFTDLSRHIGEKLYACKYCPKRFLLHPTLLAHEHIHTGTKRYVCQTCGKAFVQGQQLKHHESVHAGGKRYMCETCGRGFTQNGNLKAHKRIHTGETPFKCCVCGEKFHCASKKRKHQQKAHSQLEVEEALTCLNENSK